MEQQYTVYKAKVVGIEPPSKEKKKNRKILVAPIDHRGTGPYPKAASPPSWIPTSTFGSGVTSFPDIGQECLVAELRSERHIISYTPPQNVSAYGMMRPHKTPEGGVTFGVKGLHNALISMDRQGGIELKSNLFSSIEVRGDDKSVSLKSFKYNNEFAGGFHHSDYDSDDKTTPTKIVYTAKKDNPGFSDTHLATEESYKATVPPTYNYVDKSIITAGYNEDGTVYNLETRQNRDSAPTAKNVFTKLSLGMQNEHSRWGNQAQYPGGTAIEWSAKKNIDQNVESFLFRWGKLRGDYQGQGIRGEIYRKQILEGLNKDAPYGNPQTDPAGRGKGYSYGKKKDAAQQFTESFGYLGQISDSEQKNSFYRRFLHRDTSSSYHWSKDLLGGDNGELIWRKSVGKDKLSLNQELTTAKEGIYQLQYNQDGDIEQISIQNKRIELKSSDDVSISIDGTGDKPKIQLKMKDSLLELSPDGLTYNGMGLVFESLVDFINDNSSMLGIDSKAAPVSMHPSTQGRFAKKESRPHTGESKGFRTQ